MACYLGFYKNSSRNREEKQYIKMADVLKECEKVSIQEYCK